MNIRKPADYSNLFSELDKLVVAQLPQMGSRQDLCANLFAGSGRPEVSRQ